MELIDLDFPIPMNALTKHQFKDFIIQSVIITSGFPTPLSVSDKQLVIDFVLYIAEDIDRTITVFCKFLDFWGY